MLKRIMLFSAVLFVCACAGLISPGAKSEFEKGMAFFNVGKYEQAIPHFEETARLEPEYSTAYLYLGRTFLNLRRWKEALPPLRSAYRLSPQEAQKEIINVMLDALLGAAISDFKKGNFQSSIDYLKEGLNLDPQSSKLQQELVGSLMAFGGELLSEGNFNEAISAYTEALQISPKEFGAVLGLARAFFNQGDFMKALQMAKQAMAIDPSSADAKSLFFELLKP